MKRWQKTIVALYWLATPMIVAGVAQIVSGLPFTLTNGTVADATQVMANFNQIANNVNANSAKNGVNSDITALTALSTPITPAQGGTIVFGGQASGGSANAQTISATTPSTYALANNYAINWAPNFTNTGATTLTVNALAAKNILKPSFSGPIALTGGEIRASQTATVIYDGTQYVLAVDTPAFGIATNLASAGTTDLGTVASHSVQITGITGITAFGATAQIDTPLYYLRFSGIVAITHNGTSLILPGSLSITTAANDTAIAQYLGSGNWQVISYTRAGNPPIGLAPTICTIKTTAAVTCSGGQANANNGTYTPTTGMARIRVRVSAGGAGGGGLSANQGTAGNTTTFGTWTALGGTGGGTTPGFAGGAGGTGGANGTGTLVFRVDGGDGQSGGASATAGVDNSGGPGGTNPFGGSGRGSLGAAGQPGKANTGAGGGGANNGSATNASGGGGAGEYVEFWMTAAQVGASLTYTIGTGGAGGVAGTLKGGDGAAGVAVIEEFYW